MTNPEEFRSKIDTALRSQISEMTSLIESLRKAGVGSEAVAKLERFGASILRSPIAGEIRRLLEAFTEAAARTNVLTEEKRRLEALYTSGILFSSETETRKLLATAIDVVIRELSADAGYIILSDASSTAFSRNIDPAGEAGAKDLSMSVIESTVRSSRPVRKDLPGGDEELARSNSVVRLGISAVLCVPLVHEARVLGAVYLDRRNRENPFTETDLSFLIAFARQIVRGIVTSGEVSALKNLLVSDARMQFTDLRAQFACPEIIGSARNLFEVLRTAHKIAPTDAPVILLGENGTGKDLLARAMHANSGRRDGPMVTINCGAIPPDLLESELFGYEPGAFTGAVRTKPGRLETADGGTIFFDEIAELSLNLQAKLLRVLQTREIERLGDVKPRTIDVRFISATNRDISAMVGEGAFREDLYYRLKVIELTLPPLRERREDIGPLARHFLKKYTRTGAETVIDPEALEILERYSWPGNIRELENVIHRSVVLARGPRIARAELPPEILDDPGALPDVPPSKELAAAEEEFRKLYILRALRDAGSVAAAAKSLGINRTHFYRLLSRLGIEY